MPYRDGHKITSPVLIVTVGLLVLLGTVVLTAGAVIYSKRVAEDAGQEAARKALTAVRAEAKHTADNARGDVIRGCRRSNGDRKANIRAWEIAARTRFKTAKTPTVPLSERRAAAAAGANYMATVGVLSSHLVKCGEVFAAAR